MVWLAFIRQFNVRVCRRPQISSKILSDVSDVYLKDQKHFQEHRKEVVLQGSQAIANSTTSAITGLPASASSLSREPLYLLQAGPSDAPVGAHRKYSYGKCDQAVVGQDVKKFGHTYWHCLHLMGKIPCHKSCQTKHVTLQLRHGIQ